MLSLYLCNCRHKALWHNFRDCHDGIVLNTFCNYARNVLMNHEGIMKPAYGVFVKTYESLETKIDIDLLHV